MPIVCECSRCAKRGVEMLARVGGPDGEYYELCGACRSDFSYFIIGMPVGPVGPQSH